jgi:hypothetical protein
VVEEAGVSRENHRPWASNWQTLSLAAANRVHPFLQFTKLGANPCHIGDRLVWVTRSNDLTHWATWAPDWIEINSKIQCRIQYPASHLCPSVQFYLLVTKYPEWNVKQFNLILKRTHSKFSNSLIYMCFQIILEIAILHQLIK